MCKKQGGTLPYALLILLQSVLYGFGNPLSKIGFESITVLWCLGIRFSGAAALIFDDVAVLPQGTVTGWLVVAYLALLCTCLSYLLLGGEAVGDRTGGSGAHRGLRGAGKLAERPKANPSSYFLIKKLFAAEIGRFLTIVMCDAG